MRTNPLHPYLLVRPGRVVGLAAGDRVFRMTFYFDHDVAAFAVLVFVGWVVAEDVALV